METQEIKVNPFFVRCIVVEAVTVMILLLSVFIIGLFSKSYKKSLKKWYVKNILDDTKIEEVLGKDGKYEV